MRIFTEQAIKEYAETHPDAKVALQEWTTIVKKSEWTCFADVKRPSIVLIMWVTNIMYSILKEIITS